MRNTIYLNYKIEYNDYYLESLDTTGDITNEEGVYWLNEDGYLWIQNRDYSGLKIKETNKRTNFTGFLICKSVIERSDMSYIDVGVILQFDNGSLIYYEIN